MVLPRHALVGESLEQVWSGSDRRSEDRRADRQRPVPRPALGARTGVDRRRRSEPALLGTPSCLPGRLVVLRSVLRRRLPRRRDAMEKGRSTSSTAPSRVRTRSRLRAGRCAHSHVQPGRVGARGRAHRASRAPRAARQACAPGPRVRQSTAPDFLGPIGQVAPTRSSDSASSRQRAGTTSPTGRPGIPTGEARRLLEQAGCASGADGVYLCAGSPSGFGSSPRRRRAIENDSAAPVAAAGIGVEVVPVFARPRRPSSRLLPDGDFDVALCSVVSAPACHREHSLGAAAGELHRLLPATGHGRPQPGGPDARRSDARVS